MSTDLASHLFPPRYHKCVHVDFVDRPLVTDQQPLSHCLTINASCFTKLQPPLNRAPTTTTPSTRVTRTMIALAEQSIDDGYCRQFPLGALEILGKDGKPIKRKRTCRNYDLLGHNFGFIHQEGNNNAHVL